MQEKNSTKAVRAWRQRNPDKRKSMREKYKDAHPQKYIAARVVEKAIRKGILPQVKNLACANPQCEKMAEQYHHHSYELKHCISVIPLCVGCHNDLHNGKLQLDSPKIYTAEIAPIHAPKRQTKVNVKKLLASVESEGFTGDAIRQLMALAAMWGLSVQTDDANVVMFFLPVEQNGGAS